jgi:serine/threonine protein phosphatase PrpC
MAEIVVRVGGRSEQGIRPNNEDTYVVDRDRKLFLVADGMGGQDLGEQASSMAAQIIPRALQRCLEASDAPDEAVQRALAEANEAIVHAGRNQPLGRRMGTTAVVAVQQNDKVYVAGLGDSRAYLIRGGRVEQLTADHTVAEALVRNGALTREQAADSPWGHVLYKFLGCVEMNDGAEVRPFAPQAGDRLLLASDGLTNHVTHDDLRAGAHQFTHPQEWADRLVEMALERGSKDNVTCVIVAFDRE